MNLEDQLRRYGAYVEALAGAGDPEARSDFREPRNDHRRRSRVLVGATLLVAIVVLGGALWKAGDVNSSLSTGTGTSGITGATRGTNDVAIACPGGRLTETSPSRGEAVTGSPTVMDAVTRFAQTERLPLGGYSEESAPAALYGPLVPGGSRTTDAAMPSTPTGDITTQVVHRSEDKADYWLSLKYGANGWNVQFALGCEVVLGRDESSTPTSGPPTPVGPPCPPAALGSWSMTEADFRSSYAAGLNGPDAALYEMMLKFRVSDVQRFEALGICIEGLGVGVGAEPGRPVGPNSTHRLQIMIQEGRLNPDVEQLLRDSFTDPSAVVISTQPRANATMGTSPGCCPR